MPTERWLNVWCIWHIKVERSFEVVIGLVELYSIYKRRVCVTFFNIPSGNKNALTPNSPHERRKPRQNVYFFFNHLLHSNVCKNMGGGGGICCCCFCSITTISGMFLKTAFISLCSTGDLFNSHPHLLSWLALRWLRCFQQRGSVCCWCRLSHAHLSRGFSADSEWGINKTIISAS